VKIRLHGTEAECIAAGPVACGHCDGSGYCPLPACHRCGHTGVGGDCAACGGTGSRP
jgi:hypothetical protein